MARLLTIRPGFARRVLQFPGIVMGSLLVCAWILIGQPSWSKVAYWLTIALLLTWVAILWRTC